ncbi:MAG: hypothetical protein NC485_14985, partial [Ruminococcus flavefaciens]|nr:hypothetical protein [Ruminococcus flavefaciens]
LNSITDSLLARVRLLLPFADGEGHKPYYKKEKLIMKNKVTLNIDKDIVSLAGYDFGKSIYCSQVKENININENFSIEIPSNVKFVASSFVQGFFGYY